MKRRKLKTGEVRIEIRPPEKFNLHCCDCGLTHIVALAVEKNGNIGMAMRRDQKATEVRRGKLIMRSILWKKRQ